MKDDEIIKLYFDRCESAIAESDEKYGLYCVKIADNILGDRRDSEECVSDTWVKAWNTIPPQKPAKLSLFFGAITRNLAIDRYRKRKAEKYGAGQIAVCLDELNECIGANGNFADELDLKETLDGFLYALKDEPRRIFMLRYWYMYPIKQIATMCSISEGAVKMSLQRTRNALKKHLEKEGVLL
ncbi:MAG: RNA polymerase sigma factor [Oscillospiraceae bacterium]|nr:RNA polymerase sigma factor [Oscillospiraceae bacterium]